MPIEVWTSPNGYIKIETYIPEEGYENETREEWAERIGLDLNVPQYEDPRTPEERAKEREEAVAELDAFIKAEGLEPNEEQQADIEAFAKRVGWRVPNSKPASQ